MKRFFGVSLALTLSCAGLCGCSGDAADGGPVRLKLGYVMAPQGAAHEAAEQFAALVAEKTAGAVEVEVKHSAQLGTDRQLTEGLLLGTVDLVLSGFASVSGFIPQYEPLEAPFAFRDYGHMEKVLEGDIGQEAADALREQNGIEILAWWPRGPRYLTANRPVRTPADLKGLKLRVPELPHYIAAWKILGANTTPITYSEMFMALKQGVAEGQENPLEVIYTAGLYDVQDYVMETKHLIGSYLLMMGAPAVRKLDDAQRAAIREAAAEAGDFERRRMLELEAEYKARLREHGMEWVVPEDRAAFARPVVENLPERFSDRWKDGLYARIRAIE